jgi:hypothetical protein
VVSLPKGRCGREIGKDSGPRQPLALMEGILAKPHFQRGINRRRLLASTAAVTAAAIVPGEATALSIATQEETGALAPPRPALNVCAATARRLAEIGRRNEIRREAGLPLLSIAKELKRLKALDDTKKFEAFAAAHRKSAWDRVLKSRRKVEGNVSWFEGLACQNDVRAILLEKFRRMSHCQKI